MICGCTRGQYILRSRVVSFQTVKRVVLFCDHIFCAIFAPSASFTPSFETFSCQLIEIVGTVEKFRREIYLLTQRSAKPKGGGLIKVSTLKCVN